MAGAAVTVVRVQKNGGVAGVRDRLRSGLSPLMTVIAETLVSTTVESFTKQASPMGEPWKPLSPVTAQMRLTKGQSKLKRATKRGRNAGRGIALAGHIASQKALVDKGLLRGSIHGTVGPLTAAVVTNDVRARVHQFGNPQNRFPNGPGGRRKGAGPLAPIPARPFMPVDKNGRIMLPPGLQAELMHMIRLAIADGIIAKRAGAKSGESITLTGSGGRSIGNI
jgi:phage gpG-like protein